MAQRTGLEPATPGVTGRYSNQLNYHSAWDEFAIAFRPKSPTIAKLIKLARLATGLSNPVFRQYLASPRGFEPL